jgi:hypothetical protein
MIPPSLHFEEPNPQIDFGGSPFFRQHEADGVEGRSNSASSWSEFIRHRRH